jgi:hypothetical protein
MGSLIENRPVGCTSCGYGPVNGNEHQYNIGGKLMMEVRWVCPRCGTLIRIDEEVVNETQQ